MDRRRGGKKKSWLRCSSHLGRKTGLRGVDSPEKTFTFSVQVEKKIGQHFCSSAHLQMPTTPQRRGRGGRKEREMKDSSVFPAHVRARKGREKMFSPKPHPPPSDRSSFERRQSQRREIRRLQRNCCLCCISLFSLLPSSPSSSFMPRSPLLSSQLLANFMV